MKKSSKPSPNGSKGRSSVRGSKSQPSFDRTKQGRFAKGNPGGPGRPKGSSSNQFSTEELLSIAAELTPVTLMARVQELISLDEIHTLFVEASKKLSLQGRVILELELSNQRLAAMLINARLEAEVKAAEPSDSSTIPLSPKV